jgi:hypothetical protein
VSAGKNRGFVELEEETKVIEIENYSVLTQEPDTKPIEIPKNLSFTNKPAKFYC